MRFPLSFELAVVLAAVTGCVLVSFLFSPLVGFGLALAITLLLATIWKPEAALLALVAYLPFESVLTKGVPDDVYVYVRFFPEVVIYLLFAYGVWKYLFAKKRKPLPRAVVYLAGLFALGIGISTMLNLVSPTVALLGARQIVRFMVLGGAVLLLNPSETFTSRCLWLLLGIGCFESCLGILQGLSGGSLDALLLPADERTLGSITLTTGVSAFWDEGSRIFATLGRYDRLGNFLYLALLIAVAYVYETRWKAHRLFFSLMFLLGIPALLMTFSRASWFAFLIGFVFIGLILYKDRRVALGIGAGIGLVISYLAISGLKVRFITEGSGQSLIERFFETFSLARWRGEYYGLGRVYWFVQTLTVVIPAAPLFGFGPGQYGGGAVAALGNRTVYGLLGLPFGVFGTDGYIDINWFSLWGELGTFGLVVFIGLLLVVLRYGYEVFTKSTKHLSRIVAATSMAYLLAISFNAFLSTVFEIRTAGFYLWLLAGLVCVVGANEHIAWPKGKEWVDIRSVLRR